MSGVGVNDIPVGFGVLGLGDNEVVGIGLSEFRLFGLFYLFDFLMVEDFLVAMLTSDYESD